MVLGIQNRNSGDIRKIQKLLGHKNIKTTKKYSHVSKKAIAKIKNPVDDLFKEEIEN
jgi:site-specific recombinase XerD